MRIVGDGPHLFGGDVGQLVPTVADVDAPQARHGVEIGRAIGVDHGGALGADDDQLAFLQRPMLDEGVQDVFQILGDDARALRGIGYIGEAHARGASRPRARFIAFRLPRTNLVSCSVFSSSSSAVLGSNSTLSTISVAPGPAGFTETVEK